MLERRLPARECLRSPRLRGGSARASENTRHYSAAACTIRLSALFDGSADFVAPFRPGTIVIADVIQSQQISEHKPGVTRALADPAINNRVLFGTRSALIEIDFCQFRR